MNRMMDRAIGMAVLGMGMALLAHSQASTVDRNPDPATPTSSQRIGKVGTASAEVIRQIDDPSTGDRWLLTRDPSRSGGPARFVRVVGGAAGTSIAHLAKGKDRPLVSSTQRRPQPVIRSGDRIILEESTSKVDARFEAIALGSAGVGSPLRARLVLGGKVVQAVALGSGRAAFAPRTEALP